MSRLPSPPIAWFALSPLLVLLGGALALLVVGSLTPRWPRGLYAVAAAVTAGAAGTMAIFVWNDITAPPAEGGGSRLMVSGAARVDLFAVWVTIAVCAAVLLTVLVTNDYLERERMVDSAPEVYSLYLMAAIGAVVMGAANDLIVLFLGLEIMSIAMYVLAASHRRRPHSQESGMKYFVLGGFSSAFFLYGVALVYGATGETRIDGVVAAVNDNPLANNAMSLAGVALMLVGLGFKATAVPFHFWTPDVYQGAPSPVTAFLASVGKVAAFAAVLRVLVYALPSFTDDYRPVIWVLAVLTLVFGSVMAVVQTDVKRMLAFSSVSHAGFLLVGVEAAAHRAGSADKGLGVSSTLLYALIYAVLVCGTFAVVTCVGRSGDSATDLGAFRGLARAEPALALGMTVLLLAQAGVPLTSGFVAKFAVIRAAVTEDSYAVAIIAMVAAVIAAFLYLRIMVSMWIADPEPGDDAREPVRVGLSTAVAIVLAVGFTLVVGFFFGWLIDLAEAVAR
jgi:NADH-quinone oxidoreductase subunit N